MQHLFITTQEYETMPIYALNDTIYKRIEKAFADATSEKTAHRFMLRVGNKTLRELSCNSYVDILSLITIY